MLLGEHARYNNTITGDSGYVYPEFKGYHAGLYWASLLTTEGAITMVSAQQDVFLRLFTPAWPAQPVNAMVRFPGGGLSFLDGIPPMGNKFHKRSARGRPAGRPNTVTGDYV